jgi:antitoxin component YwqK of YwqJK toxin-antitoxin module
MKQLLTLLLCALCLASCEKQQSAPVEKQPAEVDFDDKNFEMLNEGKEATYKGKPYTGLIRNKHSNGKTAGEYPYIDGKMHGVMKEWWENGQQSAETNFDHGQRHGLNRYWDMKGHQTKEQIYDHDKSISEKHL